MVSEEFAFIHKCMYLNTIILYVSSFTLYDSYIIYAIDADTRVQ